MGDFPTLNPDLASSDFHLFTKLKEFTSNDELKNAENIKLNPLVANVSKRRMQRSWTDKCLDTGDCVEK